MLFVFQWLEGEGTSMGRQDAKSAEAEEGASVRWTEGTDEEEEKGVRAEHTALTDQRTRDASQVLRHWQRQHCELHSVMRYQRGNFVRTLSKFSLAIDHNSYCRLFVSAKQAHWAEQEGSGKIQIPTGCVRCEKSFRFHLFVNFPSPNFYLSLRPFHCEA